MTSPLPYGRGSVTACAYLSRARQQAVLVAFQQPLQAAAFIALVAFWVAWFIPFLSAARKYGTGRPVAVRQPRAKWGLLLQTAAYALVWFRDPQAQHPAWMAVAGIGLAALSTVCAWAAVRHLAEHWRFEAALTEHHRLIQTGPYRIVRHPIYASMFGMLLATGLILSGWPYFLAAIVVFLAGTEIRVRSEDELLAGRFGPEFQAYKSQVAAYIPYVR